MSDLFEIQRIWDAWPNIQNQQVFRDLFRQLSSPLTTSSEGTTEVNGVFVIPGHVFIAASSNGRAKLYAFSCTLPQRDLKTYDDHESSSLIELGGECSKIVNIIKGQQEGINQQIYVVQDNAELDVFQYNSERHKWIRLECLSLSNSTIQSCILHSGTSDFIFCEKLPHVHCGHSYQIVARKQKGINSGSVTLGAPRVILTHMPPLQLLSFQDGVCFFPSNVPYPSGLLVFWAYDESSQSDLLKPFLWNCTLMLNQFTISGCEPLSFRSLAQRLAGTCKNIMKDPCLVSLTVNPLTDQLLVLAGDGTVYTLQAPLHGQVKRVKLTKLSDFAHRWSSVSSLFSFPSPAAGSIHIFTLHTFLGLFIKGEIRIYDCFSGEFLWESDEHEGAGSTLWTMSTIPNFCGLHDNSGVWLIKSRRAVDQANFMANALFPISTNADETTPGSYLECGQVLAAKMCRLWGLKLWRVKYSLEAGFEKVKGSIEEKQLTSAKFSIPYVSPDLMLQLGEDCSLQNPALLIALLAEYPAYGEEMGHHVSKFLQDYHQNVETPQEPANDLLTPLNSEIVPLLEKYYELEKDREELITQELMTDSGYATSVRQTVCQLLTQTDNLASASEEMMASTRSRLHSLCDSSPEEALLGIKDFFGVSDFKEAVDQLQSGQWHSHRNWKGIFATEQTRGRQSSGYMQPSHSHIPLFEETCRLLYRTHPDILLTFVTFAQLARDYQALEDSAFARKCRKEFFYHRALLALPAFISPDLTPVSPEALRVHSQLLLCSGYPNAEMTAVQLLLSNDMWEDAISLVEHTKNEDNHCALFHCLISHCAKGGVLNQYIDDIWKLLPKTFSVFDFLSLLKGLKTADSQISPVLGSNTLTVSSVAPRVLDLLKQSKVV